VTSSDIKSRKNKALDDRPELMPPGVLNNVKKEANKNQSSLLIMLLTGLVIFLLVVIFYILFKPDNSQTTIIKATTKSITQENTHVNNNFSSVSPFEVKTDRFDQKQTDKLENLINRWLLLDSEVEQENISLWADKDILQARNNARQGEQFSRQANYELAEINYKNAISIIEQVKLSKSSILNNLLQNADNALAAEDFKTAKQLYEKVLQIDSVNKQGLYGLKRSVHFSEVIGLYKKASRMLTQDDEESVEKYNNILLLLNKAVEIDKEYLPAMKLLEKIQKKNNRLLFKRHITQSMKSLEENKFNSARKFLNQARVIDAQDPAVKELENRIKATEKSHKIRELKQIVLYKENKEQWSAVVDTYNKILKIEPRTIFAMQGKIQAETFNGWYEQLEHIIDHPERLHSDKIRQSARRQVSLIKELSADKLVQHRKLDMKLSRVNKLIDSSFIDINVELLSDNITQIEIYKVGRLGQFKQKTVILKPGKYTVVGSRLGYRDMRLIINISGKDKNPRFSVICMEVI
jgi:tetratricopeptide (TPR) repeat protein